jgi:hypothetical protein
MTSDATILWIAIGEILFAGLMILAMPFISRRGLLFGRTLGVRVLAG